MNITNEPTSIAPKKIKTVGLARVKKTGTVKHMPGCGNVAGCKC
jgi:hypothetical protein